MFLKEISDIRRRLQFRLTFLYAVSLTLSFSLVFSIFYFRIHSLTMERMDKELLEEIEEYSTVAAEDGFEGIIAKIAEEAESEDPDEEFYRLIGFDGKIYAATDMSSWGYIDRYPSLARTKEDKASRVFQTLTIPEREYKARMMSAVVGFNAILQIGETFQEAEDYLKIFRDSFPMFLLIAVVLSAISGWLIAKRALLDMEEVIQKNNVRVGV